MKIFISLMASLFIAAGSFAADDIHVFEEDNISGISGYTTFTDKETSVSIDVPSNWEAKGQLPMIGSALGGGRFYIWRGPQNSVFGSGYTAIILIIAPVSKKVSDVKAYSNILLKESMVPGGSVLARKDMSKGGDKAIEITMRMSSLLLGSNLMDAPKSNRKIVETTILHGDIIASVQYTAEEKDFDAYLEAYKHAAGSIKFK